MISCDWKEVLEPVDYIRSGVLVVAFLATALGSAETWIQADTLAMAAFGSAWIFFPSQLLSMQTDIKLDYLHLRFGQGCGVLMLALAAFNYLNRKSRDPNVWLGVFISRIVGGLALLITQINTLTYNREKKGWTLQYFTFSFLASTLFLVANFVQTWKTSTYSSSSSSRGTADHLSKHIFLCLLFELLAIFMMYSDPYLQDISNDFLVKALKLDVVHLDLAKYIACFMLTVATLTLASLNFDDNTARKSVMLVTTMFLLGAMALDINLQFQQSVFKKQMFLRQMAQYSPLVAVAGLGYLHTAKHM